MRQPLCHILQITLLVCGSIDCTAQRNIIYYTPVKNADSLRIYEGIRSTKRQKIVYKKVDKKIATIILSKPVMVAQADREEKWGYFQFLC